ncbi:hypothetical protein ACWDUM_16040 [Rhodococcus sp. NPDC003322]
MVSLRIVVPEYLVMDGMCEFPTVGASIDYALTFVESAAAAHPEMRSRIEVEAELLAGGRRSEAWTGPNGSGHAGTYSMLLHGEGWCAQFASATRHTGPVVLTGVFEADFPAFVPDVAHVYGTVTRRRMITRTSEAGSQDWTDSLTGISSDRTGFRSGLLPSRPIRSGSSGGVSMVPPPDAPWVRDVGILVDLAVADRGPL